MIREVFIESIDKFCHRQSCFCSQRSRPLLDTGKNAFALLTKKPIVTFYLNFSF